MARLKVQVTVAASQQFGNSTQAQFYKSKDVFINTLLSFFSSGVFSGFGLPVINITAVVPIYSASSSLGGGNPSAARVIGIKVLYTVSYNTYIPSSSVDPGVSSASLSATVQSQVSQTLVSAVTSGDFSTQFAKSCSQSCSMTNSVPSTIFSVLNAPTIAPVTLDNSGGGDSNGSSPSLLSTLLLPLLAAVVGVLVLTSIVVYYKYVYSSGKNKAETQIIKNALDTSVKLEPEDYDVDLGDVYRNGDRRNDNISGVNPLSPRNGEQEMQQEKKVNLLDMIYGAENHNYNSGGKHKLAIMSPNTQRK